MRDIQYVLRVHRKSHRRAGFPVHAQPYGHLRPVRTVVPGYPTLTIPCWGASKNSEIQSMKTVSIFTPYCFFSTSPRYLTMASEFSPSLSTVRYTDLGAFAPSPYSSRTTSSSRILSILLTEMPVISTELATNAAVSAATEMPLTLFSPSRKTSNPVSANTASTTVLLPMVMVTLSLGLVSLRVFCSCNWSNGILFPPNLRSRKPYLYVLANIQERRPRSLFGVWSLLTSRDHL